MSPLYFYLEKHAFLCGESLVLLKLIQLCLMTEWQYDSSSGYYYHQSNGFCYDANSGFYFSDAIGIESFHLIF